MSRQHKAAKVRAQAEQVQSAHNSGQRAGKVFEWTKGYKGRSQAKRENRSTRPSNQGAHPTY